MRFVRFKKARSVFYQCVTLWKFVQWAADLGNFRADPPRAPRSRISGARQVPENDEYLFQLLFSKTG